MKRFVLILGVGLSALLLGTTLQAAEPVTNSPVKAKAAVHVASDGVPVTTVARRHYRHYGYGPRYHRGYYNSYYYGPRYRGYYGYGPRYYNGYRGYYGGYYGPSYYRGPFGAVNVYPGGVNVGGLHVGW